MANGAKVAIAQPIKKNLAKESRNNGVLLSISNFSNLEVNIMLTADFKFFKCSGHTVPNIAPNYPISVQIM